MLLLAPPLRLVPSSSPRLAAVVLRSFSTLRSFSSVGTSLLKGGFLSVILALGALGSVHGGIIAVDPEDATGSRSVAAGELATVGSWSGDPVVISWDITFDGSLFTYAYTVAGWGGRASGLSHIDFVASDGRPGTDAFTWSNVFDGTSPMLDHVGTLNSEKFGAPTDAWGMRFELDEGDSPQTLVIVSDRAPAWGSFSAKSGGGLVNGAQNTGWHLWDDFLADTSTSGFVFDKSEWIPIPDSTTAVVSVPEPSSWMMLGGIAAMGVIARFRRLVA